MNLHVKIDTLIFSMVQAFCGIVGPQIDKPWSFVLGGLAAACGVGLVVIRQVQGQQAADDKLQLPPK